MLAPRSIPLKRIAECEEVASLVTYLASDLAHFINGTMIEIEGKQMDDGADQPFGLPQRQPEHGPQGRRRRDRHGRIAVDRSVSSVARPAR